MILSPVAENSPDPDCPKCGGDGVPQSFAHLILGEDYSNKACPECWAGEEDEMAADATPAAREAGQ